MKTRDVLMMILLTTLNFQALSQSNQVPDQDEFDALKSLWDNTNGASWTNKTGWPAGSWPSSATAIQMDTWFGVVVTNGDITELQLTSNHLTGTLPVALNKLSKLVVLRLDKNSITGSIPLSYNDFPALQQLYLSYNSLSGPIPDLGRLSNLKRLGIGSNSFAAGPIPPWLPTLLSLEAVYLSQCNRNGEIPRDLANLKYLNSLGLAQNSLTGNFPVSLTRISAMQAVDVGYNQLSGSLPDEIGSMLALIQLSINDNEFTVFPSFPSVHSNLIVQLQNNRFDFGTLETLVSKFKNGSVFVPQKNIRDVAREVMITGNSLVLKARPTGVNTTVAWEKQNGNGLWSAINNDQDLVPQTYTRNTAALSDAGSYRWKSTSTKFPNATIVSELIQVNTPAAFALENWCFQYKYDGRRRMTHKKIPGADWIYMVYDDRDRLMMTQDGEQRKINQWTFTRYDVLNRPVSTGLYKHTVALDQPGMSAVISRSPSYETFPGSFEPLTITYYDNYDFIDGDPYFAYRSTDLDGQYNYRLPTAFMRVTGKITGTWVRVLGKDHQWLRTVNHYDDHGRIVQIITDNHKYGQDILTTAYDFNGKVVATRTTSVDHGIQWNASDSSFSKQQIAANTDGWVEFTCPVFDGSVQSFGLSVGNPAHVGYGILQAGTIQVQENGVPKGNAINFDAGDIIRIERRNTTMYYIKNGVPFWTTALTSLPPLNAHTVLNPELYNPRISIAGKMNSIEKHFDYDHAGRLVNTWHRVDNADSILLSKNEYNGIGQLADKRLHSTDNRKFHQTVDYRYNIRGWLTSISGDLFGMELLYNEVNTSLGNTASFNGNISAMKWNNFAGPGVAKQRSYSFNYDRMNRVTSADPGVFNNGWASSRAYRESGVTYDLNGNIKTLLRTDESGALMDSLKYDYENDQLTSNVLRNIVDSGNPNGFTDVNNGDDYLYDSNGNMTSDKNKSITSITYNHINLPEKITKTTGEYINYTYDATGRKLAQDVYNPTDVRMKRSDYRGEWLYENDTLKFVNHDEGRVVLTGTSPEYQYHLKDHLGNVRVTFTTKHDVETSTTSFESPTADFLYYDEAVKVNSIIFDHTHSGSTHYSTRLNGSSTERYGLAKSLSVMPGDTINAEVFVKYLDPDTTMTPDLATFLARIINGSAPLDAFKDGGLPGSIGSMPAPFWMLLNESPTNNNGAPKAHLNWLVFDRNYILKDGGSLQITTKAAEHGENGRHERLAKQITIQDAGYVYLYLSNDNYVINHKIVDVYFDDFKVEHVKGPIVQSEDYYPFGLTFNSHQRENSVSDPYQYNGKELQDELNLGWLDYGARMYQPDIGRWSVIDPKADQFTSFSPYNYVYNDPVKMIDPDGRSGEVSIDHENRTITVTSNVILYGSAANNNLASGVATDVQNQWNAAGGKVAIDGNEYSVSFVVSGSYNSSLTSDEIAGNTDIKNNFIKVSDEGLSVSYMDGIGSNTGEFLKKNVEKSGSTTEAHEMGHSWGAVNDTEDGHPVNSDIRGKGQPGIMQARGTFVDAQYQYDPNATAGAKGGSLNPDMRKVTQQDIDYLGLDKLKFNKDGKANLGTLTNEGH